MANRSYLYAADSQPAAGAVPKPVRCISEHKGSIPLAHMLLVGRETVIVPSMIWDARIGIAADFAGGAELLERFLRLVSHGVDNAALTECIEVTTAHLRKQRGKFFLLETGEIITLGGGDGEREVDGLVGTDIPDAVAQAEAALAGNNEEWLASVRAEWRDHFASSYSDWLYISFPSPAVPDVSSYPLPMPMMTEDAMAADAIMELVNGTHARWALGEHEAVLDDLRRAVPEARRLSEARPAMYREGYIGTLLNLEGRLDSAGHLDADRISVLKDLIEALGAPDLTDHERWAASRLQAMRRLARTQARSGDLDAALGTARAARAEAAAKVAAKTPNPVSRPPAPADIEELGECAVLLSTLLEQAGLETESIAAMDEAISAESDLQVDNADRSSLLLTDHHADRGMLLMRLGRPADAEESLRSAVRGYAHYHAADPDVDHIRHNLALCARYLGLALAQLNRPDEALAFFEQALAACRAAPNPNLSDNRAMLAARLQDLGVCLSQLGRREEAVTTLAEAATMWRGLKRDDAAAYDARRSDLAHELLVHDLVTLDRKDEAITLILEWQDVTGRDWPPADHQDDR